MTATKRVGKAAKTLLDASSVHEVIKQFRCGFELETEATGGHTRRAADRAAEAYNMDRPVNEDRLRSYADSKTTSYFTTAKSVAAHYSSRAVKDAIAEALIAAHLSTSKKKKAERLDDEKVLRRHLKKCMPDLPGDSMLSFVSKQIPTLSMKYLKDKGFLAEEFYKKQYDYRYFRFAEKARKNDEYRAGPRVDSLGFIATLFPNWDSKLLQVGTDGTVPGFELRTVGALTVPQFIKAADIVFNDGVKHTTSSGCSFHIHVSVAGMSLKYSKEFQLALYEFLVSHIKEVPEKVRRRWMNAAMSGDSDSYYRLGLRTDKYSFVHFHNNFKTWEFRCFGDVDNKKDAVSCLMLALRAMMFAIKATNGKTITRLKVDEVEANDMKHINECLMDGVALTSVLPPRGTRLRRRKLEERLSLLKESGGDAEKVAQIQKEIKELKAGTRKSA